MRKFEKISLEEYHKCQIGYDDTWYNNLKLPERKTKNSAGYDTSIPFDLTLKDHSTLTNFKKLYCEYGGFGGHQIIGFKNCRP